MKKWETVCNIKKPYLLISTRPLQVLLLHTQNRLYMYQSLDLQGTQPVLFLFDIYHQYEQ